MHKLCYLFVLHFVIKIALGENSTKCICPDSNREFITPVADKNVTFGELLSTSTMEQKILQRLGLLEDSVKGVIKEIEENVDSVLAKENEKFETMIVSLNNIETLIREKRPVYNTIANSRNCREATKIARFSGIYDILVKKYNSQPFKVYCEDELFDGGWTVVAKRMNGSVNFNRNWTDYKQGFGDLDGEFFIGLDKLYALTNGPDTQELMFVLEDFENNQKYAKYSSFSIGDESEKYFISALGDYSGDAGDSFSYHKYHSFKTIDRDDASKCTSRGAWWYNYCIDSNLFGSYLKGAYDESKEANGIVWKTWLGYHYSLKSVQMMLRPQKF